MRACLTAGMKLFPGKRPGEVPQMTTLRAHAVLRVPRCLEGGWASVTARSVFAATASQTSWLTLGKSRSFSEPRSLRLKNTSHPYPWQYYSQQPKATQGSTDE